MVVTAAIFGLTAYEAPTSVYDATYVGSARCGECHTNVYAQWRDSSHALMIREPSPSSVVGDFDDGVWMLPPEHRRQADDELPAAQMHREGDAFYVSLRKPGTSEYHPFRVDHVVGYKFRQVYLNREEGGVLRRLPLQWSVKRGEYFPYWNLQEGSAPSVDDLWMQMRSQNSAWNLFCARCHVTNLEVIEKSPDHSTGRTRWSEPGIACEACHGPGSAHSDYFATNYVNRAVAFANSKVRGEPVAYVAVARKMDRGRALSVCARCHGPDIMMASTDAYRRYEPGYGGGDHINDLSPHFKEFPLQPG
ncbi:MAG: multiheme c-type cytochrome, partial [Planctomycetota bacterium]